MLTMPHFVGHGSLVSLVICNTNQHFCSTIFILTLNYFNHTRFYLHLLSGVIFSIQELKQMKIREKLTEAAHAFGEVNLYLGDDGKIYA